MFTFLISRIKKEIVGKNLLLLLFLLIFFIVTTYQQAGSVTTFNYYEGLLENIQALTLFLIIIITFLKRKLLGEIFGKSILYFRFLFFGFILFEEMSFITKNLCQFCDSFNSQGEFNLHNMPFFVNTVVTDLPLIDDIFIYINNLLCNINFKLGFLFAFIGNIKEFSLREDIF